MREWVREIEILYIINNNNNQNLKKQKHVEIEEWYQGNCIECKTSLLNIHAFVGLKYRIDLHKCTYRIYVYYNICTCTNTHIFWMYCLLIIRTNTVFSSFFLLVVVVQTSNRTWFENVKNSSAQQQKQKNKNGGTRPKKTKSLNQTFYLLVIWCHLCDRQILRKIL